MRSIATSSQATPGVGLLWVIYLVAGGIVSATHGYWTALHHFRPIVSSVLALLLWPLLLVGVNLHIH